MTFIVQACVSLRNAALGVFDDELSSYKISSLQVGRASIPKLIAEPQYFSLAIRRAFVPFFET